MVRPLRVGYCTVSSGITECGNFHCVWTVYPFGNCFLAFLVQLWEILQWSWNPYNNSKTGTVGLRPSQPVRERGNNALATVKKWYVCMHAHTCVLCIYFCLSCSCNVSDWLILYLGCASKINALVKHCWVCMHLGVKVRRNGFVNVPGCHDPSMAKCWKVNPICSNYTVSNVRECLLPTG